MRQHDTPAWDRWLVGESPSLCTSVLPSLFTSTYDRSNFTTKTFPTMTVRLYDTCS